MTDTDTLREALEKRCRDLSVMLSGILGGGSEWFSSVGDQYYVDPKLAGPELQRRKTDAAITKKALFRQNAALATLSNPEPAAVGIAETIPCSPAHTQAVFDSASVPAGAPLYVSPVPIGGAIADWLEHKAREYPSTDWANQLRAVAFLIREEYPSSEAISPPGAPTATELDTCNEAMVCTGCGTTKTVAFIKANSPTAFTCCPERKMIPVRDLWSNASPPDARAVVEALDELDGSDFEAVRRHSATLRASLQSGASK